MSKTDITAEQLQNAAEIARWLNDLLDKCNQDGLFFLIGFDLDYLADQFEQAAGRLS